MAKPRRALFIGRFQPFHDGHKWLIDQALNNNKPVLIAVMMMDKDKNNPHWWPGVIDTIKEYYYTVREYTEDMVKIIPIPPIESVNYGRNVGYHILEHKPPKHIAEISATSIRETEQ